MIEAVSLNDIEHAFRLIALICAASGIPTGAVALTLYAYNQGFKHSLINRASKPPSLTSESKEQFVHRLLSEN